MAPFRGRNLSCISPIRFTGLLGAYRQRFALKIWSSGVKDTQRPPLTALHRGAECRDRAPCGNYAARRRQIGIKQTKKALHSVPFHHSRMPSPTSGTSNRFSTKLQTFHLFMHWFTGIDFVPSSVSLWFLGSFTVRPPNHKTGKSANAPLDKNVIPITPSLYKREIRNLHCVWQRHNVFSGRSDSLPTT